MASESAGGIGRRRLLGWGGLTAGALAAGLRPSSARADEADTTAIPPDARPGGAYDKYVAKLAAEGKFSGVVMLARHGRTVLSRSYGMADREKGVRNDENTAFNLSSAGKPFGAVAILQLAQQGKLRLSDTVGAHLTGFAPEIADRVTLHHLLSGTSGLSSPDEDLQRVYQSRDEVHDYCEKWARESKVEAPPGTPTDHAGAEVAIPALIVEAVSGMPYWDYVEQNIFKRCGMTGTAFYTRPQWLTDQHIAHSYMRQSDGSLVDCVRNLDKGSLDPYQLGKNPGRNFIDPPGDGGFATAPDLVRFATGLADGTLLDRHYAELLTGPKIPHGPQGGGGLAAGSVPAEASFGAYSVPVSIINGQWLIERAGVNPGSAANWNIYPDTGWVGIILANTDGVPFIDLIQRETQAITGQS
ncbi:serine hydrolase domain-containing protein [Actinomadura rupiterrae]|uniref:serine hydrolase domain-containing protein n=1 Tax=Actinomadura rupiterrae TaxID=559627 RepID=UPI0020A34662|nr:serine hydrolase domain-containing protein [Actinomadura rupiterrae]MCP2338966.1 CubicO group peptidase (beta-lactamase class C family) [Actinomadura rupiterrae]